MWDLPRPGLEPVSPALAGTFLTTAPPGKSSSVLYVYLVSFLEDDKILAQGDVFCYFISLF